DSDADGDRCLDDRTACQSGEVVCVNVAATDPAQIEVCDPLDRDEDCDGGADDLDPDGVPASAPTWYADRDGDTFGDPATAFTSCEPPPAHVQNGDDCDDDPAACGAACHPGRLDLCDGH